MPLDFSRLQKGFLALIWFIPYLALGRERITLTSGFSLEADSHQHSGSTLIFATATGSLELLASDVIAIDEIPITSSSSPLQPAAGAQTRVSAVLAEAARQQGLPIELVTSVAMVESGLNLKARSAKGAIGLMQLMPGTAKSLGVAPLNVDQNVNGGAQYLRLLLERFRGNVALALAAYNAGPGNVAKFGGVPPFGETEAYIKRVLQLYEQHARTGSSRLASQGSAFPQPKTFRVAAR